MNLLPWLDDLVELAPLIDRIIKDGVSLTVFLGIAVFFLKKYRKRRPTQLDRIERKMDILAERQGVQWDVQSLTTYSEVSATRSKSPFISRLGASITALIARLITKFRIGGKRMKEYLKKLGRTKFQALLVSLIVNVASAVLFLTGTLEIDAQVDAWMPIINMTVGTISTWVYIIVEGGIDKANVQGGQQNAEHPVDDGPAF